MPDNLAELCCAIQDACQATGASKILQGRRAVLELDRTFVLGNIENVARASLNLDDYWEYRRLLELCSLLDPQITQRIAGWGIGHHDPDVREAALDFTEQGVGD